MRKHDNRVKGKKNVHKVKKDTPRVLSRKERRREQRKSLKIKKHEYFANKRRTPGLFVRAHENVTHVEKPNERSNDNEGDRAKKRFEKELQQTKLLKQQMKKSRDRQLLEANKEEDKVIRRLEKQLKLNKRKSKSIPKSFASDGLDYLLEVCDSENLKDAVTSEQNVYDSYSDIDDDFTAVFGKADSDKTNNKHDDDDDISDKDSDLLGIETDSQVSDEESEVQGIKQIGMHKDSNSSSNVETSFSKGWSVTDLQASDDSEKKKKNKKRKLKGEEEGVFAVNRKKVKSNKHKHEDKEVSDSEEALLDDDDDGLGDDDDGTGDAEVDEFWEDIYGRTRDKAGNIVKVCDSENLKDAVTSEQNVYDSYSDIDDDFTAVFGKADSDKTNNKHDDDDDISDKDSDLLGIETDSQVSDEESEVQGIKQIGMHKDSNSSSNVETSFSKGWSVTDLQASDDSEKKKKNKKRKLKGEEEGVFAVNRKKVKSNKHKHEDKEVSDSEEALLDDDDDGLGDDDDGTGDAEVDEFWEDIYGRTRDKAGNIVKVCDSENLKDAVTSEQNVYDSYSDIDDDFTAVFGKADSDKTNNKHDDDDDISDKDSDLLGIETDSQVSDEESEVQGIKQIGMHKDSNSSSNVETSFSKGWSVTDLQASDDSEKKKKNKKRKLKGEEEGVFAVNRKKVKSNKHKHEDKEVSDSEEALLDDDDDGLGDDDDGTGDAEVDEFWEDIYGRTRDKAGNIVKVATGKYVPPHMRLKNEAEDDKKQLLLSRLKKQMKGLFNRLSEGNMKSIATQVEQLYMSNSRHDMNKILSELLMESLVSSVRTPERLIMEHALLVAVLHSNVDTEVGIYFLQAIVKRFHELCSEIKDIEDKQLDNIVLIISHLYNFKVFDSVLMYDILEALSETFTEKEIELILIILKSVGFTLRKDNPIGLKELILRLQRKAGSSEHLRENTRVKFMLDVLLAIKNNNMAKIPNYDTTHSEHLKKSLKGILNKGAYVTEVKLTLQDLLKADQQGRWWVVGSAWTGALPMQEGDKATAVSKKDTAYSSQLLELARKQRMNTDIRRDIFCIVMTAEDYLDGFEKLLHLGLKNQQEREIIHVTLDCCIQEKRYNPYYSHLIQKFCDFDRKYQMITQCAVWDKLKELKRLSQLQVPNLAQLLIHLFINKGLALSTLKVINFAEVNKTTVHLLRQILLGILLHDSQDNMQEVFCRVSLSPKLQMFRESMRIFVKHFVLKNAKSLPASQLTLLNQRAETVDRILSTNVSKLKHT